MKKELQKVIFRRMLLKLITIQTVLIFLSIAPINLAAQNLIDANVLANPPINSNYKVGMTIRTYETSKGLWENLFAIRINNKWGVMNSNWTLLTPIIFDDVYQFSSGVAQVKYNGKSGLIDVTGAIRIQPKYDEITFFYTECPIKDDMKQFHSPNDCNKSFYRIADKWGIIDKNGNEITPAIYSSVPISFMQSTAAVSKNNKWGMIDSSGKVIIPCVYKKAIKYFQHGYDAIAFVDDNEKIGIFNIRGELIVPFSNQTLANLYLDLGANYDDQVPPVFKVNGKLILAKNLKRLEPDPGIKLSPNTLATKNQNSFIYKHYHSVKSQSSNNLTDANVSTPTSKSSLLEGNSKNIQSNNSSQLSLA